MSAAAAMQVFTETQGIVMEFEGTNFLITCTAVTVQDKMGDPVPSSLVCSSAVWAPALGANVHVQICASAANTMLAFARGLGQIHVLVSCASQTLVLHS